MEMEDPESEWAIQEYSPSKEGETTMVKWILNKGYSIGKKMVITGIVISSAPLVVPPLVVFSAMGVAFSVPFGLVLASYACTNTLMSKLLPTPASPFLLEYYADEDEDGVDSKFDLHEGVDDYNYEYEEDEVRKENVTQEEEEERIMETEEGTSSHNGYEQEVEALTTRVDGDVDEKGYYTDDEEKGEDDEQRLENVVLVEYHGLMEENLDENEDEKEREDEKDVLQREHDIEEKEGTSSCNGYEQEVEALTTHVDGDVDEKGYFTDDEEKEGEDDELRLENVVQMGFNGLMEENLDENEDEKEREDQDVVLQREYNIEEEEGTSSHNGYGKEVETLKTNVDGDVDEKGYYTDDEEKEGEDDDELGLGNVVQVEYHGLMEENTDENEDEKEREDEDDVLQREYDIEEEEREQMEDINKGIEMRLGFDMAGDEHKQTQEVSTTNSSGVDEQGYVEDDGDDDSLQEEGNAEEISRDETEQIVKESTGLVEKIREEGKVDDAIGDESTSNEVFEEGKDVEMTEPVTVKEIESQKLVKDGSKNEEPVAEMHRVVILAEGNEENNFNSREIEELDLVARQVVGDTRKEESDAKVMRENMEKTAGNTSNDGSEDAILKIKDDHSILLNEDAREIGDESGLDLFDGRNTSMNFEILKGGDEVKESTADDQVDDVMSLPGFRHAQLDSDRDKVTSKTGKRTPSREDVLEDEKIWEKIGAMRAIVGYKAPSQPTSIEELKALYVFTGVEPPASFKGDSDRDEVNAKLKFLMSIVGVK